MWLVRERELEEENRQSEERYPQAVAEEYEYKISLWLRIKHSCIIRGLIILVLVTIIAPVLILLFLDMSEVRYDEEHTCIIRKDYQIPCGPQNTTLSKCLDIYGCWDDINKTCFHSVPSQYQYHLSKSADKNYKPKTKSTPFGGKNNLKVYLTIIKQNENDLSITLHEKPQKQNNSTPENANYNVKTYPESMTVEVSRKNTSDIILSTSYGPTVVSTRYWEWSVDLKAEQLFGLDQFRFNNETVTKVVYKNANSSAMPKFMAFSNGTFHGLTIDHTGPLEITVLPSNLVILRLLSGEFLTLHLSIGPTPYEVVEQQRRQVLVDLPYWALGVHICRDGNFSSTKAALEELNKFHKTLNNESFAFPYDSDCIHENLFSFTNSKLSQTEQNDIDAAITELRTRGKHFVMSLAPQVSQDNPGWKSSIAKKIVYTNRNGNVTTGTYLGKEVIFPDYSLSDSQAWFNDLYSELSNKANSFVLRSNWPENNAYEMEESKDFQYLSKSLLEAMSKTLPWDSLTRTEKHMNKHNTYGCEFSRVVTNSIIKPEDSFIMSASSEQNCNNIAHVQNVNTTWVNFKRMLTQTLSHSMFGPQLFSVPVCGSTRHYSEKKHLELCLRWYLTAATMPMFRISSDWPRRDPTNLDSRYLRQAAIDAIKFRYTLLPYLYTILPNLMVRPMFFDYYNDNNTFALDEQYMVGDGLLVVQPVVAPIYTVKVYLPKRQGGWFEYWGGNTYGTSGWNVLNLVENDLVMFVAAGKIIPMQDSVSSNAETSRALPLKLIVALDCSENKGTCGATGNLRAPDSHIWKFDATEHSLQVSNYNPTAQNAKYLTGTTVKLYGVATTAQHFHCTFIDINTEQPYCNYTKLN